MKGYKKTQTMRLISLFLLVPLVLIYAILSMIEHYGGNWIWLLATIYIFMDAIWTAVYTYTNYMEERIEGRSDDTFTYIRLYDVLVEGPIFIWFGLSMMRYYRTSLMFWWSGFIVLYGFGSLIYNGYNHISHYHKLEPIRIGDIELNGA
jgi:hypothetical protein